MQDALGPITGADGELIRRFVAALRACAGYDHDWLHATTLGLRLALPLRDRVPGLHEVHLDPLSEQLDALAAGATEEFVVRAARDEVTRETAKYADTAAINAQRRRMVEFLDEMRDDPILPDRVRRRVEHVAATDDQLHDRLQQVKDRLAPVGADEAARCWIWSQRWAAARDAHIADAHCDQWIGARQRAGLRAWRG